MSRLNDMIDEMATSTDSANEVKVAGGTNDVKDESIAVDSTSTSDVESKADETPKSSENNTDETNANNIADGTSDKKVDKSQFTPEQKAEYAFKKRLDRERKKYDSQILELKKQLEALQNPNKPKTREDFANDEEYIKDYFGNMINDAFAKREEENRRREEALNAQASVMEGFANQVTRDFGSIDDYNNVVESSLDAGLGELIEKNPTVKQFIQSSDNSAKVLYALATDQNAVNKVFTSKTEWDMFYNLKRLEETLADKSFNNKATTQQANNVSPATNNVKPIGKIGAQGGQTNENWEDRSWLMKQIRGR